jgi:hypothetical protein
MTVEVSMRLGRFGKRWGNRCGGSGRHGLEAFGGEPIETTVLDPGDEAAELGDQA